VLQAVSYFFQKHDTAQANYTIHDKKLLAVMKCLAQWDVELKMVRNFTVITNYKNLEYFTTRQLLSERYVCWADTLSMCNVCGRTKPWRELKRGLLRSLPLPDRIWKEISMDFVTDLPLSDSYKT
jgi:hypothetical protein